MNRNHVTILGAGAWGRALACAIAPSGKNILLWQRSLPAVRTSFPQPEALLEGEKFPWSKNMTITDCLDEAFCFSDTYIIALSTQSVLSVLSQLLTCPMQRKQDNFCFIIACKGIDIHTEKLISQLIQEKFPPSLIACIAGPNLAHEVQAGQACGLTIASLTADGLSRTYDLFKKSPFFLEKTHDIIGVQIIGALKNIMAIGFGLLQQQTSSANMHASYIAMAGHEIRQFLVDWGANPDTMNTFAGWSDLMVTCQGGRNALFGRQFSYSAAEITPMMPPPPTPMLTEGVATLRALKNHLVGDKYPIMWGISLILKGDMPCHTWMDYLHHRNDKHGFS